MKTILSLFVTLAIITGLPFTSHALTYTVTSNGEAWTTLVGTTGCSACTIDVPAGFTISLGSGNSCAGCTFDGGTLNINGFSFTGTTTFQNNTVNLNNSITFNNPDVFTNSTVNFNPTPAFPTVSVTLNGGILTVSNSTFNMPNGSSLTSNKGLTSSGSNYNLSGNANLTVNSPGTTLSGDNVSMSGTSSATFNGNLGMTGGSFTTSGSAAVTVNNTLTSTNSTFSFSNTSVFTPSSAANITGGSVTVNDNAKFNPSGTLTMTGSTLTANTSAIITASNMDIESTNATLNGSSTLTVSGTLTVGTGSDLTVGGGAGSAGVTASNLNVTGNSLVGLAAGSNTLKVSSGKFKNDGGNVAISSSLTGCETLNNSGASTCITLAIADIDLTAALAGSGAVALSWTDLANTTAANYLVQRSTGNNPWTTIVTIPAGPTANNYHFEDNSAPAGTVEYRIVHVDQDGKESYSAISTVEVAGTSTGSMRIFPNPATGHTFNIATPTTGEWILNVYTITGQLLLRTSLEGQTQYPIRLPSEIPAGTAVVVQAIGRSATQTFTLLVR